MDKKHPKQKERGLIMKGIVLAGGSGTRLYPLTKVMSKQLLPVYDKPTIYYPISTLMLAGIREILIISTPQDTPNIEKLLGDGSELGLKFSYKVQEKPNGIPEAFILGENFIGNDNVCLILGDNVFYGHSIPELVKKASEVNDGANVFAYHVSDPQNFGVVKFDENFKALNIEEKPKDPKSNWAVTGLYFYDNNVVKIAKNLKPSPRGELEITDVNKAYLEMGKLEVVTLGRGIAWLDTGNYDALLSASTFVQTIEKRQGVKISCLEEIAFRKKFITRADFEKIISEHKNPSYKKYLESVAKGLI